MAFAAVIGFLACGYALVASALDGPPTAADDTVVCSEDTTIVITSADTLPNDSNSPTDWLPVVYLDDPMPTPDGQLQILDYNVFSYHPRANWSGTDSFAYTSWNASGTSNPATVNITVLPVNDAPVAHDDPGLGLVAEVLASDRKPWPPPALGDSAAVSENTVILGSPTDCPSDVLSAGSAYIFTSSGTGFEEQAKLVPADPTEFAEFGWRVAISGDTAVVGAPFDDDLGALSGSAYVFTRSGVNWTQQAKLTASDGAANDEFGIDVAVVGDTVLIGAPNHSEVATESGAVYVFTRSGTTWTEQAQLAAADGGIGDGFGYVLAVSGGTLAISAPWDGATGAAYVFTGGGSSWTEQDKVVPGSGTGAAGSSIDVSGDTMVLGADYDDEHGYLSGAAYVYARSGTTWTQQARLTAADGVAGDRFGCQVAVSGDMVVIDACDDVDVDPGEGSAYVFTRQGAVWTAAQKIRPGVSPSLLWAVAMSGDTLVVADMGHDDPPSMHGGAGRIYRFLPSLTTTEDVPLVVAAPGVLRNDGDIERESMTASLVAGPGHGTVALAADGSFTYTPSLDTTGTDTFSYRASDGATWSAPATVTITVTPANDAPVAEADSATMAVDAVLTVDAPGVLVNDTDAEGDSLTATLASDPANGSVTLSPLGGYTYTPAPGWSGADTFAYRAFDGSTYSATQTVTVYVGVTPPEAPSELDVPTGAGVTVTSPEGVTLGFDSVTSGGSATIAHTGTGPAFPFNFRLVRGAYYDISVTAGFSGLVTVTVPYDENSITGQEKNLKLFHRKPSGGWEDITVSVDTAGNTITGRTSSFSPFGVGYSPWEPTSTSNADSLQTPHKDYRTSTNKCEVCHSIHWAEVGGEILLGVPAGDACSYCHIETGIGIKRIYNGSVDAYGADTSVGGFGGGFAHTKVEMICEDCHSIHGARTLDGALTSKILKNWTYWRDSPGGFKDYSTLALARWSNPATVTIKWAQETAWCTGCHKYYIESCDSSSGAVQYYEAGEWAFGGSHVMTTTYPHVHVYAPSGQYELFTIPIVASYAPSGYCRSCHNAGEVDTTGGVVTNSFPHYTPDYYRFMTVGGSVADSSSTNTTGTVDGLCLKCHRDGIGGGVGETF